MPTLKQGEITTDQRPAETELLSNTAPTETPVEIPTKTPVETVDAAIAPKKQRSFRQALACHPRLIQFVVLLTLMSSTGAVLLFLLFRGAWSDHQDNFSILSTILKMELSREDSLILEGNSQKVVTRTFSTLEPYVEADGWIWINRFGSTITYGKQKQRLIASCSPYSPLYIICDLSEIP